MKIKIDAMLIPRAGDGKKYTGPLMTYRGDHDIKVSPYVLHRLLEGKLEIRGYIFEVMEEKLSRDKKTITFRIKGWITRDQTCFNVARLLLGNLGWKLNKKVFKEYGTW